MLPFFFMRILIVTSKLDIGGTEQHLTRIIPKLRERGLDVSLFLTERGGELEAKLQGLPLYGPSPSWKPFRYLKAVVLLAAYLRKRPDTVVHFFLPGPYLLGSLACELAGHRYRVMSRRALNNYQRKRPWLAKLERLFHKRCLALVGNSNAVCDQLRSESNRPVYLIHNGIEVPEAGLTPQATFTITCVGNLFGYKGHADLLAALGMVKEKLPQPWQLMLVGKDRGEGSALHKQAKALGIDRNICWVENCNDPEAILRRSDLFVLPSHEEGFSNALLEAMAVGLPCIATRVGGNQDAITSAVNGYLIPPHKPVALANAIEGLALSKTLCKMLGENARGNVINNFSLETCIQNYLQLYQNVGEASQAEPALDLP